MKKYDWSHLDDDELLGEIQYRISFLRQVRSSNYSETQKQKLENEYLEILKSLYDEKRKRRLSQ